MLDKRLSLCAETVTGDCICDVGTDHGYLPCELVLSGKVSRAIACDIREKPLENARRNIEKYGLSDKIRTVLSDGLDNVDTREFTDIIIAGMGGELICDILIRADISSSVKLILQPMTKSETLRRFLCENGFEILSEKAASDRNFFYSVIKAVKNGTVTPIDEVSELIGFMDLSGADERNYALYKYMKTLKTAEEIKISDGKKSAEYFLLAEKIKERINRKEEIKW